MQRASAAASFASAEWISPPAAVGQVIRQKRSVVAQCLKYN